MCLLFIVWLSGRDLRGFPLEKQEYRYSEKPMRQGGVGSQVGVTEKSDPKDEGKGSV